MNYEIAITKLKTIKKINGLSIITEKKKEKSCKRIGVVYNCFGIHKEEFTNSSFP